jgi:methyl-accepting chemotaxis protein
MGGGRFTGWLGNVGIGRKLALLIGPALAATILLAAGQMRDQWAAAEQARGLADAVRLAGHLESVAHRLALERDLSVGMQSAGDLAKRRRQSDQAIQALNRLLENGLPHLQTASLRDPLAKLRKDLGRLSAIRQRVDGGQDEGVFDYYAGLNARTLNLIRRLAGRVDEAVLARQLRAYASALWLEERAARERGRLTAVFRRGSTSPDEFLAIQGYAEAQRRHRAAFMRNATPAQRTFFEDTVNGQPVERAMAMRADFLDPEQSLAQGPEPEAWFQAATDRMDRIRRVAHRIAEDLSATAQQRVSTAQWRLYGHGVFAGLVLLGVLGLSVPVARSIARPLRQATETTARLTEGDSWDLTVHLPEAGRDETGRLTRAFNEFLEALAGVVSVLGGRTRDLGAARQELDDYAERINDRMEENRQEIQGISQSAGEVNQVVQQVAERIGGVSESVSRTSETTQAGKEAVDGASRQIGELRDASQRVNEIISTIEGIAQRTDLLALNAAIEAANAGDAGQGFAVVADEVRGLAEQTAQATQQVTGILSEVRDRSQESESAMEQVRTRMDEVLTGVQDIDESANQIAASAEELAATMSETTDRMDSVQDNTVQVAQEVEHLRELAGRIGQLTGALEETVNRFRLEQA